MLQSTRDSRLVSNSAKYRAFMAVDQNDAAYHRLTILERRKNESRAAQNELLVWHKWCMSCAKEARSMAGRVLP